jgi:hypothetical protein
MEAHSTIQQHNPNIRMKLQTARDSGFSRPPLLNHRHHGPTPHLPPTANRQASSSSTIFHFHKPLTGKPAVWTAQLNPPRIGPPSSTHSAGNMASTLGPGFGRMARMRCHHATSYTTTPTAHLRARSRNLIQNQTSPCSRRPFSSGSNGGKRPRFSQRLGEALKNSKVTWYQIPVGVGIGFLGLVQFYKVSSREKEKSLQEEEGGRPQKRPRVRPEGPWYVAGVHNLGILNG